MSVRSHLLSCAMLAMSLLPGAAQAEDKIYPPGTECANLPTIAERLLCGRQEFRRNDPASRENVPAPPYDGYVPDEELAPDVPATVAPPGVAPPPSPGTDAVQPE